MPHSLEAAIGRIRQLYPRIYYACHTRHVRRRTGAEGISTRDSEILVHLDRERAATLGELAQHMDLAKSTLSEALTQLEALGYVAKTGRVGKARRETGIVLTDRGVAAVRAASVLDKARLRAMLLRLTPAERTRAVEGLALLADASLGLANRVDR